MALEAYNADGDPIEGALSQADADALVAAKEAELKPQLDELSEKLSKLENKDFNFRRLEDMTDDQRAKLSETELALKQKQEQLEADSETRWSGFVGEVKTDVLDTLVGDDEELKKKVELNFARIKDSDKATKRSEIKELMEEALAMSVKGAPTNPLRTAMNASGSSPVKPSGVPLSDEARAAGKLLGLSDEDLATIK